MRIGIDARYVQDYFPGIGRYTFNLIKALAKACTNDKLIVFHNPKMTNSRFDLSRLRASSIELTAVDIPTFSLREQWQLPLLIKQANLDVYYSPYYIKPYIASCPSVVTIHDASGARFPEYLLSKRARMLFHVTTQLAATSSRLVVTDSQFSKEDIVRYFKVPAAKIRVIYPAADEFVASNNGKTAPLDSAHTTREEHEPFILYVGIDKPHKNLSVLVRAFAKAEIQQKLYLVGRFDPRYPQTRLAVESLGIGDRVSFLGEIADEELARLYQNADFFVFPSLCEGFGLPVLEAMSCGLAVISSDASALPEVVGDAGILISPQNVDTWIASLRHLATDSQYRRTLGEKGKVRSTLFSWDIAARELYNVFQEAAGK